MSNRPTFGAIVLAAGCSKRFGDEDKLLAEINGIPMIRRTVGSAVDAELADIVVMTGDAHSEIEKILNGMPARLIRNATSWAGMGTSLAVGANALQSGLDAAFIVLGDMPMLRSKTFHDLMNVFNPASGRDIIVPVYNERRGHPVLFAEKYMPLLRALDGDTGAREILLKNPERVQAVNVDDPGTLADIDTPADIAKS